MKPTALLALAALAALTACTPNRMAMRGVETIHNADATRVWVIEKSTSGDNEVDHIIYCDAQTLRETRDVRQLCVRWPQ
jgi:hypothetical protein